MDEVRERLVRELRGTIERLRQLGGAMVIEDTPGAIGDNSPFADEMDVIQLNEDREISFATRSLLIDRANKLADALERVEEGAYGVCEECGEPIAPARLKVMPEVTTCVRCQDRIERELRRSDTVGALFGAVEEEE
jgi:DnaK suppressor protein